MSQVRLVAFVLFGSRSKEFSPFLASRDPRVRTVAKLASQLLAINIHSSVLRDCH
jgi:hypothetical protein